MTVPGRNRQATAQLAALPDGWINEDGVYNWSMVATDGELWSNWVGNCEFTVDSKVPNAPVVAMASWTANPTSNQSSVHTTTAKSLNSWTASRPGLVE